MVVFPFFYDYWMPNLMTFCQLTWHSVVIEEWKYHHSNRLVEVSRMVVFPFFYDHWTPRYLTKRHKIGIFIPAPFEYLGIQWLYKNGNTTIRLISMDQFEWFLYDHWMLS